MAKHSGPRHRRKSKSNRRGSAIAALLLLFCVLCFGAVFLLRRSAEPYRPEVGEPPYRVAVDAGHGGSDPGARGVVQESDLNAATASALVAWLRKDSNYIPLQTRESYDVTAKPSERAAYVNAFVPDLLLSVHANSAGEGSTAAGFECYPSVPGRTYHRESLYFAGLLAWGMHKAGATLRGNGGVRYIYYLESGEKQLVETNHDEVRAARTFTLLEDANCPAVLAEQCFVTSVEDVDAFGDEDGCKKVARIYYEAICTYFGTEPLEEPQSI